LSTLSKVQFGLLSNFNPFLFLRQDKEFKEVERLRKKETSKMLKISGIQYNINVIPD